MGAFLRWLLSKRSLPVLGGAAAGVAGTKLLSGPSSGNPISGAFATLPPVAVAGATVWIMDRVLPRHAFGGRKSRDVTILALGAGAGLVAFRQGQPKGV